MENIRSSRPEVFCKKGVLRNFTKFTGKHLCQSLFFNKVAGLTPANFIKKEALAQVFCREFCEISKNTFFIEHLWWLLLKHVIKQPKNTGSYFFSYKGTFSIILMALVVANYKFIYVDVGCNGRSSDGSVFRNCSLSEAIERNYLNRYHLSDLFEK